MHVQPPLKASKSVCVCLCSHVSQCICVPTFVRVVRTNTHLSLKGPGILTLMELAPGAWTPTHTQLRCIMVLIRAGNKAVLLEEEGKKQGKEEREGGRGWEGRKREKKEGRF